MDQLSDEKDAVTLLKKAIDQEDWQLCKEVIRFLYSIDEEGTALLEALVQTNILPHEFAAGKAASIESSPIESPTS